MYSLNATIPGQVAALAADLAADLPGATARPRGEHTLVIKRLGAGDRTEFQHRRNRVRETLRGTVPFEVAVTGIDWFETPESGSGPVVYLVAEGQALYDLHDRLCEVIDPIEGLGGAGYVPHVTIARGGDRDLAKALTERELDPIRWTVQALVFWDASRSLEAGRLSLPL
ncbi:2'-5' RNA ligase family protein [Halobacteriales archaeon Cl-PHB]